MNSICACRYCRNGHRLLFRLTTGWWPLFAAAYRLTWEDYKNGLPEWWQWMRTGNPYVFYDRDEDE